MSVLRDEEQQFILRVQDPHLAEQLKGWLRGQGSVHDKVALNFDEPGRDGTLHVDGQAYPVALLDLPTVVESYKTYDDTNLVKTADIGQMLLVGTPDTQLPGGPESDDGVTPAMRAARRRCFRPAASADPMAVAKVEKDVAAMLAGRAPEGVTFEDVEEEFVIDEATGNGRWVRVRKQEEEAELTD